MRREVANVKKRSRALKAIFYDVVNPPDDVIQIMIPGICSKLIVWTRTKPEFSVDFSWIHQVP